MGWGGVGRGGAGRGGAERSGVGRVCGWLRQLSLCNAPSAVACLCRHHPQLCLLASPPACRMSSSAPFGSCGRRSGSPTRSSCRHCACSRRVLRGAPANAAHCLAVPGSRRSALRGMPPRLLGLLLADSTPALPTRRPLLSCLLSAPPACRVLWAILSTLTSSASASLPPPAAASARASRWVGGVARHDIRERGLVYAQRLLPADRPGCLDFNALLQRCTC